PSSVIERNDSPVRKAEGLEPVTGILHGSDPGTIEISDGTVTFSTSFLEGQKTGLYLDQFDNYRAVAAHAAGRNVLDLFTNQGGFALHAAKAGAASVTAIDISETATAATAKNAKLNDLTNVDVKQGNVFDHLKYLTGLEDAQRPAYDLIILDPPSFTRAKKNLRDAIRGYKEIHLRSLQLLKPGGLLATFCCSHHVTHTDFRGAVCAASVDAKKSLREISSFHQRLDHPVVPTIPETEYLKGYLYQVTAAF
ncbi:MAG: class I SAM-dependent methyltransferase, partial [Verrucomicrobiales bacterium]|nr:class I SAM-dependent methyltransferase [Verrucomicrobiales bacterium]